MRLINIDEAVINFGFEWDDIVPTAEEFISFLKRQKTIDAVPVVRCRECKWYQEGEKLSPNKFCFRLWHPTENRKIGYNFAEDDFCSYGERKEEQDG